MPVELQVFYQILIKKFKSISYSSKLIENSFIILIIMILKPFDMKI